MLKSLISRRNGVERCDSSLASGHLFKSFGHKLMAIVSRLGTALNENLFRCPPYLEIT
jgi:hypothetical protein